MSEPLLEVCVDSLESAKEAVRGGAKRLELCSSLVSEGGLTPSVGLYMMVRERIPSSIPIYVMLRPRPGNFVYSPDEVESIIIDAKVFIDCKVQGFVFGALTINGDIDEWACVKIMCHIQSYPVTFSRAFDWIEKPLPAVAWLQNAGFSRILTSGQESTVVDGLPLILKLIKEADGKIIILPGGGLDSKNISLVISTTGLKEYHASGKALVPTPVCFRNMKCPMGTQDLGMYQTDQVNIQNMVIEINKGFHDK